MKVKKILLPLMFCFSMGLIAFGYTMRSELPARAESPSNVVYVNGEIGESGDGNTAEKAVKTLKEGYNLLSDGGTIVLCGDITVTAPVNESKTYFMEEKSVTITGRYGGVDYAPVWTVESDGTEKANIQFSATTILKNLTINRGQSLYSSNKCVELWSGPSLTVGECVNFTNNGESLTAGEVNGQVAVRVGDLTKVLPSASYAQKSGTISFIQGGNNKQNVINSSITLSGTAKILDMLQCGGTNKNVDKSTVNISDNVVIDKMYVNGYGSATSGDSDITITGGTIQSLTATRVDAAVTGKITGNVNITIASSATIKNLALDENDISIEGTKNLTYSGLKETEILSNGFADWDTVTIADGATVCITGDYTAPATALVVKDTGKLILNACFNSALPIWQGSGSVTREHIIKDSETLIGKGDKYSVEILMALDDNETLQGTAVYGNYLFAATKLGKCYVYSISQNKCIGEFWFVCGTPNESGAYANHSNQMMFGAQKYNENDKFPLIYITTGNSGNHDTDGSYISKCAVERISYDESTGAWSSVLVQTIQFNDSANIPDTDKDGDLMEMYDRGTGKFYYASGNGYDVSKGYQKIGWGWSASFVDMDPTEMTKDKFYLFCPRFRTTTAYEAINISKYGISNYYADNNYIITAFDMPALPTSENDFGKTVTLYPKDIVDQFETEYDIYFTQGGTMYQGRIYYSFGQEAAYGQPHANGIRVFDIATERIISRIDLSEDRSVTMGTGEKEPECCAFYNGKLVLSAKGDNNSPGNVLYIFDYIEFNVWTDATCTEAGMHYTVCGYCGERVSAIELTPDAMGHSMKHHMAVEATCTQNGTLEYWNCSVCGKIFEDEKGIRELDSIVDAAHVHQLTHREATEATCDKDGNLEYWYCPVCQKIYSDAEGKTEVTEADVVIPAIGSEVDSSISDSSSVVESENNTSGCHSSMDGIFTTLMGLTLGVFVLKKRKSDS